MIFTGVASRRRSRTIFRAGAGAGAEVEYKYMIFKF
jgi:hypothetical protein